MSESWAVLEAIYMERIAELEAARDAFREKAESYQQDLVRLQARVRELESALEERFEQRFDVYKQALQ